MKEDRDTPEAEKPRDMSLSLLILIISPSWLFLVVFLPIIQIKKCAQEKAKKTSTPSQIDKPSSTPPKSHQIRSKGYQY